MAVIGAPTFDEHALDLIAQSGIHLLARADVMLTLGVVAAWRYIQRLTPRRHAQLAFCLFLLDHFELWEQLLLYFSGGGP